MSDGGAVLEEFGPEVEQAKTDVLGDVWKPLGQWPQNRPPPRQWLVVRPEEGGGRPGVLPLGKVGLLAGAGAAGKSWLTTQLAVAVASGARWVGLEADTTGKVLLVLGEEEAEEANRRLHHAGEMMELTNPQRTKAAQNLVVLPMAGRDVALTRSLDDVEPGQLPETPLLHELRRRLGEGGPWALVVLDPLARFAGADVETDNAAATRFVQVLEQLAKAPGTPSILVTHHTTKTARREGAGRSDAAAATAQRGASALTDGVRWQANLEGREHFQRTPRLIDFRVVKTNYGPPVPPMTLTAPADGHGALRVATEGEISQWSEALEAQMVSERGERKRINAKAQGRHNGRFSDGAADDGEQSEIVVDPA
jgi:hypothetical protein